MVSVRRSVAHGGVGAKEYLSGRLFTSRSLARSAAEVKATSAASAGCPTYEARRRVTSRKPNIDSMAGADSADRTPSLTSRPATGDFVSQRKARELLRELSLNRRLVSGEGRFCRKMWLTQHRRLVGFFVVDRPLTEHQLQVKHQHVEHVHRLAVGIKSLATRLAVHRGRELTHRRSARCTHTRNPWEKSANEQTANARLIAIACDRRSRVKPSSSLSSSQCASAQPRTPPSRESGPVPRETPAPKSPATDAACRTGSADREPGKALPPATKRRRRHAKAPRQRASPGPRGPSRQNGYLLLRNRPPATVWEIDNAVVLLHPRQATGSFTGCAQILWRDGGGWVRLTILRLLNFGPSSRKLPCIRGTCAWRIRKRR